MRKRKFTDLTEAEVRELVDAIFSPKKITCVRRRVRDEEITCKIYTEWEGGSDENDGKPFVVADDLTLRNPFIYGERAISVDFSLDSGDYRKMRQFCLAKGIEEYPEESGKNPFEKDSVAVVSIVGRRGIDDAAAMELERRISDDGLAGIVALVDETENGKKTGMRKIEMSDSILVVSGKSMDDDAVKALVALAETRRIPVKVVGEEGGPS